MEESQQLQQTLQTLHTTKFRVDSTSFKKSKTKSDVNKRSCDNCRKRKVRCDSILNNRCSQCKKAGIECKFLSKPKKTGPPTKQYTESLEKQIQQLQQLLEEERNKNLKSSTTTTVSTQTLAHENQSSTLTDLIQLRPMTVLQRDNTPANSYYHSAQYPYRSSKDLIKEIPNLTPELAERMIIGYFDFLHLNCPIIDKRLFLIQFYYEYPHPVEEFLFYAVCAVGSQFLPRHEHVLARNAGRNLRKKAMQVMSKAYTRSSLTTVQVLVLVSLLAPNCDDNEGSSTNWLLLGAAIRMGQDLELHCDSRQNYHTMSEIQVRRRIAYILYALDKISAASSGRPYTVKDEDFDVELPLPYEAQPEDDPVIDTCLKAHFPKILQDTDAEIREKRPIYSGFLDIIPLARMIGYVLSSFYTGKPASSRIDVTDLDTRLMTWQTSLSTRFTGGHGGAFIRVIYDGLILLRYRPLVLFSQKTSELDIGRVQMLSACTVVASEIIEFLEASPVWGVPCLKDYTIAQAATIFLQNCNSEDDEVRLQARRNLRRCASLYQRDDIVNQTKNAIVLNELASQLPEEEATRRMIQRTDDSITYYNNMDQEMAFAYRQRQLLDSYNDTTSRQQQVSLDPVSEFNINELILDSLLQKQSFDVI
ncbi:fungal-specific transcription factor domain-containing protein [Circinella umbellata]|nr:fungal-specific transcription factor domain-containing protein [Circinella umbellata]